MESPQQQTRPRSKSTFSFKSDKSQHSASKHERKESYSENKPHLHPTTKADPNAAMNESQPIAAALEAPTLQSLRSFQHTDVHGNPIAEPDLSNPTRSRWERPLDTIRSFEAAIDNEYRRRAQTMRAESTVEGVNGYGSRRSSYYGGGYDQNRYSQASGYYGSRQAARDSWADNGHGTGGPVGGPPRARYSRMQSDPGWNRYNGSGYGNGYGNGYGGGYGNGYGNGHGNGYSSGNGTANGVYPSQGYHQSRDTVNTNGSNGSHSEPYSNDPNSDNSSFERAAPVKPPQPDLAEQYGFQGFGGGPILEEYSADAESVPSKNGYFPQQPHGANGYGPSPPVPAKTMPPPLSNKPIKLNQSNSQYPANGDGRPNTSQRQSTEKRRSWFKRRFSKD